MRTLSRPLLFILLSLNQLSALELDDNCLQFFPGVSKQTLYKNLRGNLDTAERAVTWCEYRNPEIMEYTREWRKAYREGMKVRCKHRDGLTNAQNISTHPQTIIELVGDNSKKILSETFTDSHHYTIHSIIHELFHSTSANSCNAETHNAIQTIPPNFEVDCDSKDVTTDRMSIISSLCSGEVVSFANYQPLSKIVFEKIRRCGLEKGCVNTMTTSFDDSTWRKKNSLKSKGLELEQARKLCSRLYYKGACGELEADRILLSPYQQVQHVLRSKELTALRKEMGDLLQEIPSPDGFIPRAFINANPALKRGVESMQKDVCLHERFQLTDKGLKCHSSWTQGNYCEAPLSSSKRDPRCTDQGRKRLDNWVTELVPIRNELHPLQSLVNLSEKDSYLIPLQNLTTAMNSPLFIGLTGKLKAAQLLKVLNRHYPAASKRNCETANQWDIYGLLQTLDKIPKEPKVEEPKCD